MTEPDPPAEPLPPGTVLKCFALICPETEHLRRVRIVSIVGGPTITRLYCRGHLPPPGGANLPGGWRVDVDQEEDVVPVPIARHLTDGIQELLEDARMLADGEREFQVVSVTSEKFERDGKMVPRVIVVMEAT